MDHTVVHFEIPANEPERAAKFYRELFGWEISRWGGAPGGGEAAEYWMVRIVPTDADGQPIRPGVDRKSTRLNSSHDQISYAVFCLKKKTSQLLGAFPAEDLDDPRVDGPGAD